MKNNPQQKSQVPKLWYPITNKKQTELTMPKMKSNSGAAKRFKRTGSGKIRKNSAFTSHILTTKTTKRKRNLRKSSIMAPSDAKRIKILIPY